MNTSSESLPHAPDLRRRPLEDVRIGAAVSAVALGGFGAWAALVPLTEGVVAVGTVAGETEHQTIQHLEGGIVETVRVHEGSEVAAGDVLLELRDTQARAERERLDTRAVGLRAELARLEAERQERDEIVFAAELTARRAEPEVAALLTAQRDLFAMRRRQYRGRIELLRHRIEQYEERIRGLEASRTAHQREHVLIERDVDTLRALHARQLVDEGTLIARQRESEQTAGRIGSLTAEIAAARVAIGEARQEVLQLEHTRHTEVAERLSDARQEWYATRERLVAVQDVLTRTRIEAPQAGKVIGLTAHTVGGVIEPGESILHLVPSDTPLIVEGRIRPTDIDRVHAGQTARLRFSAFSARTTPTVQGRVVRVSPDAFQDEVTQEAYYGRADYGRRRGACEAGRRPIGAGDAGGRIGGGGATDGVGVSDGAVGGHRGESVGGRVMTRMRRRGSAPVGNRLRVGFRSPLPWRERARACPGLDPGVRGKVKTPPPVSVCYKRVSAWVPACGEPVPGSNGGMPKERRSDQGNPKPMHSRGIGIGLVCLFAVSLWSVAAGAVAEADVEDYPLPQAWQDGWNGMPGCTPRPGGLRKRGAGWEKSPANGGRV